VDLDCCAGFSCQSGTCTASCGQEYQPCQFQGDCCNEQGLECEIVGATSTTAECYPGNYYQPYDSSGQIPTLCGADCSGWECQLGAACSPYEALDPCAAVGLVCDEEFSVCRAPGPYVDWNTPLTAEECNPAGQACLPVPDSTVQPSCVYMPQYDAGFCLETCESNADCVDPYDYCDPIGDGGVGFCRYWITCSDWFGSCDSSTDAGDGLCMPEDFGYGRTGFCLPALTDGGGSAGTRCASEYKGNRQNGSFCDTQDVCSFYGLCEPTCNAGDAGTDAGPGCPAGQSCVDYLGENIPLSIEIGFCSPACDFTSPDGGGCPKDATGIPEKCEPRYLWDLTDVPTGICMAGAADPVPAAQVCPYSYDGEISAALDPCVAGSLCLATNVTSTLRTCAQLCDKVGQSSGCPANQSCQALIIATGVASPTHTGYCGN
jgi:hypothetical protein